MIFSLSGNGPRIVSETLTEIVQTFRVAIACQTGLFGRVWGWLEADKTEAGEATLCCWRIWPLPGCSYVEDLTLQLP